MAKNSKKTITAVQTTCRILNILKENDSTTVTEIANELNLAKSGIQYQLQTLCDERFVVKEGLEYRLSLRFLDMAEQAKQHFDSYDIICEEIDKLAAETGEVAQFATEEHNRALYVYKSRGAHGVETASDIGYTGYLHSTALGKAILTGVSEEEVEEIADTFGLPKQTQNTITSLDNLHEELSMIRDRGYAIDDEENVSGLRCVAVPVTGRDEQLIGAISVSGPSKRMSDERVHEELTEPLIQTANVIQINTRFS